MVQYKNQTKKKKKMLIIYYFKHITVTIRNESVFFCLHIDGLTQTSDSTTEQTRINQEMRQKNKKLYYWQVYIILHTLYFLHGH